MPDEEKDSTETGNTEAEESTEQAKEQAENAEEQKEEQPDLVDDKFEFVIPEGLETNESTIKDLKEFMVKNAMTKETAQAFFDHAVESQKKAAETQKAAQEEFIANAKKEIKADPDIGGANYDKVQKAFDKITLRYGGEDFKKQVNDAGLKNDAIFLRFINNLNTVLSEDKVIVSNQSKSAGDKQKTYKEMANTMFPNANK